MTETSEEKTTALALPENVPPEAIAKFEVLLNDLTEFNAKALSLKVDIEKPETYKEVYEMHQQAKDKRTAITTKGKQLREDAVKWQKQVIQVENYLTGITAPGEANLKEQREIFEAEKERKKREKEEAELAVLNSRIEALAKFNATADIGTLKVMSEIAFESLLSEHEATFKAAEIKRIADELKAEEDRKELERLRQAEETRKANREKRSEELRPYIVFIRDYDKMMDLPEVEYAFELGEVKKGAELQWEHDRKEQARIAEQARLLEEKEAELKAQKDAVIKKRESRVIAAGLLLDTEDNFYKYKGVFIHRTKVENDSDELFEQVISEMQSDIAILKQKEADEQAKALEDAANRERDRIDAEQKEEAERLAAIEKAAADKEAKRILRMPDKKVLLESANEIVFNTLMPAEMKTPEGQAVKDWWKERAAAFQKEVVDYINENL